MIGAALGFLRSWRFIGLCAFVAFLLIHTHVAKDAGRRECEAAHIEQQARQATNQAEAGVGLANDGLKRDAQHGERVQAIEAVTRQAQREIDHAEDLAALDAAYRASWGQLWDDADRAYSEAIREYRSSIDP